MNILESKQNGVLLAIGTSLASFRIQARTKKDNIPSSKTASHGAYLFWEADFPWVIESHANSGVVKILFERWQTLNKGSKVLFYPDDRFDVLKLKSFLGQSYGFQDILAIKIKTDIEFIEKHSPSGLSKIIFWPANFAKNFIINKLNKDFEGIFCTELLAKCATNNWLEEATGKKANNIYPSDIQEFYYKLTKESL